MLLDYWNPMYIGNNAVSLDWMATDRQTIVSSNFKDIQGFSLYLLHIDIFRLFHPIYIGILN